MEDIKNLFMRFAPSMLIRSCFFGLVFITSLNMLVILLAYHNDVFLLIGGLSFWQLIYIYPSILFFRRMRFFNTVKCIFFMVWITVALNTLFLMFLFFIGVKSGGL